MLRRLLLGVLLLAAGRPGETSVLDWVLGDRAYGLREGLPAAQVLSVHEDRSGAIWLGTVEGLAELSGPEPHVFGFRDGLPRAAVTAIAEDAQGVLFAGTAGGIARLEGTAFRREPGPAGRDERVRSLVAGPDGRLFALLGNHRLIAQVPPEAWVELKAPLSFEARSLAVDDRGHLFVATQDLGLLELELKDADLQLLRRRGADEGFRGERAHQVVADGDGVAATADDALVRIDAQGQSRRFPFPAGYGEGHRALARGPDGRLWIGADEGVAVLAGERVELARSLRGLARAPVVRLAVDRAGNVWAGTVDRGAVVLLEAVGVRWARLDGSDLRGLELDSQGFAWTSREGALWRLRLEGAELRDAVLVAPDVGTMYAAVDDPAGNLLLATERGVLRVPAAVRAGPGPQAGPDPRFSAASRDLIAALHRDAGGAIWAAAASGLFVLDPGAAAAGRVPLTGESDAAAWRVTVDRLGLAWVVDRAGKLWRVGADRRAIEQQPSGQKGPYNEVAVDGRGDVIVSLEDGSWMLLDAGRTRPLARVATRDDLRAAPLRSLVRLDDGRHLLAHAGDRISLVGLSPPRVLAPLLSATDLDDADLRYVSLDRDPAGGIWISTLGKLARLPALRSPAVPAPLHVASVRSERPTPESSPAHPRLDARPNAVDLTLSLADPLSVRKVQYRWRLLGESEAWSDWTSDPRVRVSNLPGGSFELEAEARDRYGRTALRPVQLPIDVEPLPWETLPFRIALLLLAGLVGWALYRLRTRSLRRDRERLELAVQARSRELAAAVEKLREASLTDPLTGLRNRRYFEAVVPEEAPRYRRLHAEAVPPPNRDLVFHIIDLDHFKEVNDGYGHDVGDRVLVQVARRLREAARESDLVMRWGGEEFLVVSRETNRADGAALARRLLIAIGGRPFDLGEGRSLRGTCSVGWAPFPWRPGTPPQRETDLVLAEADRALYEAKRSGRNRAVGVLPEGEGVRQVVTLGPEASPGA